MALQKGAMILQTMLHGDLSDYEILAKSSLKLANIRKVDWDEVTMKQKKLHRGQDTMKQVKHAKVCGGDGAVGGRNCACGIEGWCVEGRVWVCFG